MTVGRETAAPESADLVAIAADVMAMIETQIRPMLAIHGGGIELVEITPAGEVRLAFEGACCGCALKSVTYALGVRLFAVDCQAEVEKIARAAPGSRVFCRILSDCAGAEWPLSRKFGCEPALAVDVLEHALKLGLEPYGVSFHVGSQQRNPHAWDRALASAAAVFRECGERGMTLSMVNLGGGFPTKYLKNVPAV